MLKRNPDDLILINMINVHVTVGWGKKENTKAHIRGSTPAAQSQESHVLIPMLKNFQRITNHHYHLLSPSRLLSSFALSDLVLTADLHFT